MTDAADEASRNEAADAAAPLTPLLAALGDDGAQRFLAQVFEFWINPEIQKRLTEGSIAAPFALMMAQVIFPPADAPSVRLNEEIRGHAWTRIARNVEAGGEVFLDDLAGLEGFELAEEDFDCGHITVIHAADKWFATFNALSQRGRALNLLQKAEEFRSAAVAAFAKGHASVAVDTLFSACELASKAELLVRRMVDADSTNHKAVASRINSWRKLGNIEGAFVDLFNRLGQLRYPYRYDPGAVDAMPITQDDLGLVESMIAARRDGFARKAPTG